MMDIYHIQHKMFSAFLLASYFLIFVAYLGVSTSAPKYIEVMDYYMRIYISLFLIWRFNPFTRTTFTELDRKIVFSAGLFIMTTTALNKYLVDATDLIKGFIGA